MSSKMIYVNKMQQEVLESNERITVITAEPGAGSTTALLLKAFQYATEKKIDVTFFVPTHMHVTRSGGIKDYLTNLFGGEFRYSEISMIATFENKSKIKFVPCNRDVEQTLGFSSDLMLFDANIDNKFIQRNILRASKAVVVDSIFNLERQGSWANELKLLTIVDYKVAGFIEGIKHVVGYIDDNFSFKDREQYKKLVMQSIPEKMKVSFGSGSI